MNPTPRSRNCGWPLPKAGSTSRLGVAFCRSLTFATPASLSPSADRTDSAIPISCADSLRRCAVTTTSSSLPASPAGTATDAAAASAPDTATTRRG